MRRGRIGHLLLYIGPDSGEVQRLVGADSPHNRYADDVRFEVLLIDSTDGRLSGEERWWHLSPMDPESPALP